MKKLLALILSVVLLLLVVPTVSADTSGDFTYTAWDGKATITGYYGSETVLEIPATLEGYPVTAIGDYAFYGCTSLADITLPDSVTEIGENAFYNTAYYNNESNWEDDVLYISNHLIEAKSTITGAYTIKDGTRIIAGGVFKDCTFLTSITIPDSVIVIQALAFYHCDSLAMVYYGGTEEQKEDIIHSMGNEALIDATWIFTGKSSVGDLNDDDIVNIADATVVFRAANGRIKLTDEQKAVADVNRDGIINIADATMVFRYANGRINSFDPPTT